MRVLTPKANYTFDIPEVDQNDIQVVKETWVENVYQIDEKDLDHTGVFIDIGANIGAVSIYASSFNDSRDSSKPPIRVFAFEPQADNLVALSKNIKLNNKIEQIRIFPYAVYTEQGKMLISNNGGSSSIVGDLGENTSEVSTITFADVFTKTGVMECDLMKIDVEGAEYDILLTASDEDLHRVRKLSIEFHANIAQFGDLITKIAKQFNTHILGSPERGGYIYATRY